MGSSERCGALRARRPNTETLPIQGIDSVVPAATQVEAALRALDALLVRSYEAFVEQCRLKDRLVDSLRDRMDLRTDLDLGAVLAEAYPAMSEKERALADGIRRITEGELLETARATHALLAVAEAPLPVEALPELRQLQRHYACWLDKYERIFVPQPERGVLYATDEGETPFPKSARQAVGAWLQPSEKRGPDEPTVFRRGSAGATPGQIVREADSAAAIRCLSCCTAGRWCKVVVWRNPPTESVHIVGLVSFDGERLWVYAGAREIAETLLRALAVKVLACVEAEDSDGYTWDVFGAAPGTAEHFEALDDASPSSLRPLGLRLISVARTDIPLPTFKACAAYPDAGEES